MNMNLSSDYIQTMEIKHYSVYTEDEYSPMFRKLYKGIIVRCTKVGNDSRYCWLTIKTNKARTTIFKTPQERMYSLSFNDSDQTITCDFERDKNNKSPNSLSFDIEVYDELKDYIPKFMKKCGCEPKEVVIDSMGLKLLF